VMGETTFGGAVSVTQSNALYYYRCRGTNVAGTGWSAASETFLATDPPSLLLLDNESIEVPDPDPLSIGARSWGRKVTGQAERVDEFARSGSYSVLFPSIENSLIYGSDRNAFVASWNGQHWNGQAHTNGGLRPGFVLNGVAYVRAREVGMDPSFFSYSWRNVDEASNWMSNQVLCSDAVYMEIPLVNPNAIPPSVTGDRFVPALNRDSTGTTHSDFFYVDDVSVEASLPRLSLEQDPSIPVTFPDTAVGTTAEVRLGVRNQGGGENTVLYGAYIPESGQLADPHWTHKAWHKVYDPSNCFAITAGATLVATNNGGYQYATVSFEPTGPGVCTGVVRVATTDPNDYYDGGGELHDGSIVYESYLVIGRGIIEPAPLRCAAIGVREGHNGATRAVFTLSLATQIQANATIHYATSNGTATAGEDYVHISGSTVIPKGSRSVQVETEILGDLVREKDETFYLMLNDVENAILPDPPYAKCEIRDDESTLIIIR